MGREDVDKILYDRFEEAADGRDIITDATMDELRDIYYNAAGEDISKIDFKEFADEVASREE